MRAVNLLPREILGRPTERRGIPLVAGGAALLFAPGNNALAWWAMPATFGIGQIIIGVLVTRDDAEMAR